MNLLLLIGNIRKELTVTGESSVHVPKTGLGVLTTTGATIGCTTSIGVTVADFGFFVAFGDFVVTSPNTSAACLSNRSRIDCFKYFII